MRILKFFSPKVRKVFSTTLSTKHYFFYVPMWLKNYQLHQTLSSVFSVFFRHGGLKTFSLFLLLSTTLTAQISLPTTLDTNSRKFSLSLLSSHDIQTSSINKIFARKLINGGLIKDELIQSNFDKHKTINHLGREFTNNLAVIIQNPFKKIEKLTSLDLLFEAGYASIVSAVYSKDLFGLVFKGNQNYIGDTADFSGTNFQYVDFQNIGIGFSHNKTKTSLSVNYVNIQNYLTSNFSTATVFFAEDSAQIDLDLNGDLNSTFSQKFNKGSGFSLNFKANIEVPWKDDSNAFFQFQVQNFGFAKVENILRYRSDTTISYSGFNVDNLINLSTNYLENNLWQDTLNIKQDTISSWIILPVMFQFGKILNANSTYKLQSFFGIKMYPSLKYTPKIYAGIDYLLLKNFHAGLSASYGGFGNFRAGLYLNYSSEKINFGIGTEDFYALISKKAYGQAVNIRLNYAF